MAQRKSEFAFFFVGDAIASAYVWKWAVETVGTMGYGKRRWRRGGGEGEEREARQKSQNMCEGHSKR